MTPGAVGTRSRQLLTMFAIIVGLVCLMVARVGGQTGSLRQEDIKATFLYNFAKFVDWPDNAFNGSEGAFRIEILGRDPFDGRLDQLMIGKSFSGRRVEVVHSLAEPSVMPVQIAFVSGSQSKHLDAILIGYRRSAVLTVSDIQDFTVRGGMIGFVTGPGVVRFNINRDAVERSRLRMSSQLFALGVPSR